jgi:hypothetical protein
VTAGEKTIVKSLLTVTAACEAIAGVALAASPSVPVASLLGAPLDTATGLIVGRLAGAALLSLAVACWLSHNETSSAAASGVIAAMLLYNIAVVALLAHARLGSAVSGVGLWPAVGLHLALASWCVAGLRRSDPARRL